MVKVKNKISRLRWFNHGLSVVVISLCLYVIAAPFLPQLAWWAHHNAPSPIKSLVGNNSVVVKDTDPIPDSDQLIIPSIDMKEEIHIGGLWLLNKGVLFRDHTSVPSEKKNTVLVGHRFMYNTQAAVFYHLDKIKVGDEITVYWDKVRYTYRVSGIAIVDPSQVSIEDPTATPTLTLYTCTPLWTSKQRLVVSADLIGDSL
jgi:sortase A